MKKPKLFTTFLLALALILQISTWGSPKRLPGMVYVQEFSGDKPAIVHE